MSSLKSKIVVPANTAAIFAKLLPSTDIAAAVPITVFTEAEVLLATGHCWTRRPAAVYLESLNLSVLRESDSTIWKSEGGQRVLGSIDGPRLMFMDGLKRQRLVMMYAPSWRSS